MRIRSIFAGGLVVAVIAAATGFATLRLLRFEPISAPPRVVDLLGASWSHRSPTVPESELPALDPCPMRTRAEIESDLELHIFLDPTPGYPGDENASIRLSVRNRSASRSHCVVRPGDGSEVGWREPTIKFSALRKGNGDHWIAVPPRFIGRCGTFDGHWPREIVFVAPAAEADLGSGLSSPDSSLDFGTAGEYRFRVFYSFGAAKKRSPQASRMDQTPPFELASNELTIRVDERRAKSHRHDEYLPLEPSPPLGPNVRPPVALRHDQPDFSKLVPPLAHQLLLAALVDRNGDVLDVRVLESAGPAADAIAMAVVQKWKYQPAKLADGRPVASRMTVTIRPEAKRPSAASPSKAPSRKGPP